MPMQHEHILNPITAVECCRDGTDNLFILAGEGSYLKVYDAKSSNLLQQCQIFHSQAIHGIVVQEISRDESCLKIVVWGGPYMVTITALELDPILQGNIASLANTAFSGPDWIMDIAMSPETPNNFALITAHNTVLQAKVDESGKIVLGTPSSPSRSILYSAHILWDSPSTILVAAGTVFGEIIAWKCISGVSELLHTFAGHEGSIFGVNISQPVTFPDQTTGRLLASCSDDRTIRVWKFASEVVEVDSCKERSTLRETGFGNSPAEEKLMGYGLLATVMGHASRIWGVKFVICQSDGDTFDNVTVLSFGEDSTTQHWELEFASDSSQSSASHSSCSAKPSITGGKLVHQNTFAFHGGKHIFSSALSSTPEQDFKVVTGGADGKISMYDIEPSASENLSYESGPAREECWDLQVIIEACYRDQELYEQPVQVTKLVPVEQTLTIDQKTGKPAKTPKAKKIPKDAPNCYGFLSQDQFVMTTNFGRVFSGIIDEEVRWHEVYLPKESPQGLKSYAIITGYPELGMAFLAGADGRIYGYQNGTDLREVANLGLKIADMFKIHDQTSNGYQLLVTTLGSQVATLFAVEDSSPGFHTLQKTSEYQLPERFVVTSAGKVNDLLLLGSRLGSIAVYSNCETPLHIWTRPLGSAPESITTIIPVPSDNASSHILTTDRDGQYTIFTLTTTHPSSTPTSQPTTALLNPVHHGRPSFGPLIENAWFSGQNHDLILYGFRSKSFVVWNHTRQFEISNVECGGAHRSYAYSPLSSTGNGCFIYTKSSKLHIHTQSFLSHSIVKRGGHGREIKASAVSPDQRYIATGAEDTEIRLWSYDPSCSHNDHGGGGLECKAIVQTHTAGIQHLKFHSTPTRNYLFSSGGYEEFCIFAISDIPNFGLGVVCEATNPEHSPDRDLRIMNFDVSDYPIMEGEERGEGKPRTEGAVLISLAFSDSTFKIYVYQKDAGFTLLASGRYTSSCLMQIKHISFSNDELHFITAATDGRLVLWKHYLPWLEHIDIPGPTLVERESRVKVHQSSIKALDLVRSGDGRWTVVVTGGDDNAVGVTVYDNADLERKPKSFVLRDAHAAAVTSISFIPLHTPTPSTSGVPIAPTNQVGGTGGEEERFIFATSSNDQRVKQWEVVLSSAPETGPNAEGELECEVGSDIKKIGDAFTAVADVGDLSVINCEGRVKVVVVGNGMEVWEVGC